MVRLLPLNVSRAAATNTYYTDTLNLDRGGENVAATATLAIPGAMRVNNPVFIGPTGSESAHATIDIDIPEAPGTYNRHQPQYSVNPSAWGLAPRAAVVVEQPRGGGHCGSGLVRKPSKRRKDSVSDKTAFFSADYIEIFTIGGGTKWVYASIEVLLEIFVLAKHFGIPMAGQSWT